jgi:hypothetical protein
MVALLRGKVATYADGAPTSKPLFRCKDSPGISRCHSDDDDGVGSPSLRPRRGGDTPQDHALQPHSQAAVAEAPNLQHRVLPDDQTIEHKVDGGIQSSNQVGGSSEKFNPFCTGDLLHVCTVCTRSAREMGFLHVPRNP